ncbi:hypothetical protein F5B20DRAFT_597144 [Whalleya microplaca]|nr:hypothetical protein F5B20DRAFT_597144 [Whalleya microplaca]
MALSDLAPETVATILEFLGEEDLSSLIIAQSVCKPFRTAIQRIFPHPRPKPTVHTQDGPTVEPAIHPLLWRKFHALFDTNSCDGKLRGNVEQLFRSLPWAGTEASRAPFLRPAATWRPMSVTWGGPRITRVDVCKFHTAESRTSMSYYQLKLPDAGLTMGLLYDVLLKKRSPFECSNSWRLLLGKRLGSYDEWLEVNRGDWYISDSAVDALLTDDRTGHSAVLVVLAFAYRSCMIPVVCPKIAENYVPKPEWQPLPIGAVRARVLKRIKG